MKVFIAGTVGLPACYGGWETLVENLAQFHDQKNRTEDLTVYCSAKAYDVQAETYLKTRLRYSRLEANGAQSILYDTVTMLDAVWRKADVIVLLGISGAIALPVIRRISKAKIITNIDGIEWRREKWQGFARWFLKKSERIALNNSDIIITDNQGIADYVHDTYGTSVEIIEYGGDHAITPPCEPIDARALYGLPDTYDLSICRIEPENNVHRILEAYHSTDRPLAFVGNWDNSAYGKDLKVRYRDDSNIWIIDPTYESDVLYSLRQNAARYLHGHSAGGTNPSLVEIMFFGCPILAFDCNFNRYTTENHALYFQTASDLRNLIETTQPETDAHVGDMMQKIAQRRYTWDRVGKSYFDLFVK